MRARAAELGVTLRPHLKTAKSIEVARATGADAITVSTLREAAFFLEHGIRDLTYAVGLDPAKIEACSSLVRSGARLSVITDDVGVAQALARRDAGIDVLVEIDVGQHRGGVDPEGDELLAIASAVPVRGVLAHAGHSYGATDTSTVRAIAEDERRLAVRAAQRLREAGHAIEVVSVGSTPTLIHAAHLDGVTEARAGVYTFFDRFQHALGSCGEDDLALTVLATVIGIRRHEGAILVDAGSLALSADRSMDGRGGGYGEARDLADRPLEGRPLVSRLNQEHGWIDVGARAGSFSVGDRLRIRPNHACITAAMHAGYHVIDGDQLAFWPRANGW